MKKILCFGNPHLGDDSLAVELAKELKIPGFEFVVCQYADDLLNFIDANEILIMDVVKGIDEVKVFEDIEALKDTRSLSLHDVDVGFLLKLMSETKAIKGVKIIGLPQKGETDEIKQQVSQILVNKNS